MTRRVTDPLATFLDLIERSPETTMHAATWELELGARVVSSLRRAGVLVERGEADWYPCEDPIGGDCVRVIEPQPESSNHPFRAVCSRQGGLCPTVGLAQCDVCLLGLSRNSLIHHLRLLFGITGPVETGDAGFPETTLIGRLGMRDVFLALSPGIPGFDAWLANRRKALILVPVGRWLSTAAKERFGPGQPTELVILEEILDLVEGTFVLKRLVESEWPRAGTERESGLFLQPVVCVIHDNDGRRELTAMQYRSVVEQVGEYDLFIDMTDVVKGRGVRGSKRTLDGRREEVVLTRNEAAVVVELATAGRALRPGEFQSVSATHVSKIVEHARKKIDVALGRYEWRTIHTMKGSVPEAKAFVFRPAEGVRWAVVVPMG